MKDSQADSLSPTLALSFHPLGWHGETLLTIAAEQPPEPVLTLAHTCLDTARGILDGASTNEDLDGHQLTAVRILLGITNALHESLGLVP